MDIGQDEKGATYTKTIMAVRRRRNDAHGGHEGCTMIAQVNVSCGFVYSCHRKGPKVYASLILGDAGVGYGGLPGF